ncbi:unnamed protein product [Clonostachys byssicola]|uniref:F-box domain-containing protein n=1 Tax=Clonostachys byssicola TaxID=160290 RepID=A0A9N9XUG7_9HYPO|nr:unnamed protein product [Clonostachys byssicola]
MTTILSLPDELLAPILHASVPRYSAHRAAPLALVCRRFNRIITPLLYRNLQIECNGACGPHEYIRRTKALHRTVRSNQSLRQHCQSLVITFGSNFSTDLDGKDTAPNLAYIAIDLVKWLYNTEELYIGLTSFHDDTWYETFKTSTPSDLSVLYSQAPKSLTRLKLLNIRQENVPMHLPTLFRSLECLDSGACLRILDLTGVSQIGTEQDWKRMKAKAGTAPFTELRLRHFTQSATALEALVMWPVRLEAFHFSMPMSDYYDGDYALTRYDLGIMKTILSHQKASLSHVNIHELLTQSGVQDFNLSEFHQLYTLCLSRDLTGIGTSHVANLLAPNLRTFRWDMALEDQHDCRGLEGFAEPQEEWIRALAKSSMGRKTSLKQIHIDFHPEGSFTGDIDKDYQYPWDRMDRLAEDFKSHGINVVYSPPKITKEQFLRTKE